MRKWVVALVGVGLAVVVILGFALREDPLARSELVEARFRNPTTACLVVGGWRKFFAGTA